MNSDIRLSIGFLDHPKTVKLQRQLGDAGILSLLRLWLWTAQNRPSGILIGMDDDDIDELAVEYYNTTDSYAGLLPFLSEEGVARLARAVIARGGSIIPMLPFMDEDDIEDLPEEAFEDGCKLITHNYDGQNVFHVVQGVNPDMVAKVWDIPKNENDERCKNQ